MKPKHALVVYLKLDSIEHNETLAYVEEVLTKLGVPHTSVERKKLSNKVFDQSDLIIAVGGDGTFLAASHYTKSQPIVGINSEPGAKDGYFMAATRVDAEEKIRLILDGKHTTSKFARIHAVIKGKPTKPALNEIYFGSAKAYKTARYTIEIARKKEDHKSSGVLIATAAGSNAWLKSAGGRVLPALSEDVQYLVREPHRGRINDPKLIGGIVRPEELKLINHMDHGTVMIDSVSEEYPLRCGEAVGFAYAPPLTTIQFR